MGYEHHGFSIVHFQGRLVRQVCCYTLLSRCRLPWPLSCCQYQPTPLGLNEPWLGCSKPTFGSSALPVLLTKTGPLGQVDTSFLLQ